MFWSRKGYDGLEDIVVGIASAVYCVVFGMLGCLTLSSRPVHTANGTREGSVASSGRQNRNPFLAEEESLLPRASYGTLL